MTATPGQTYLRRGKVLRWLAALGITEAEFKKALETGVIRKVQFGSGRAYYLTAQIETVFLRPAQIETVFLRPAQETMKREEAKTR